MNPRLVVVLSKVNEFPFKVQSIPEEDLVKVFTANGSDESLNEGMQADHIETSFNNLQFGLRRRIQ